MKTFRKYEFATRTSLNRLLGDLPLGHLHTIVDLGELTPQKISVDVLWFGDAPESWEKYEIWDVEGNGFHTFLGYEFNTEEL